MFSGTRTFLKPSIVSMEAALKDIGDRAVVAVGGFGYPGTPLDLMAQLHAQGATGLTLVMSSMIGEDCGVGPLVRDGRVATAVTSYMGENRVFQEAFWHGRLEVELCPMGSLSARLHAGGAGIEALYVRTGFGTAVTDGALPRRMSADGSGRIEAYSPPRETREVNGRWCTLETALRADFALVRAWKADRRGNLVFRGTTSTFNVCVAKCARVCVAEVEELVECGELDPNGVHLPGIFVDRVVVVPRPTKRIEYLVTRDGSAGGRDHSDAKHRIARRAALEVRDGQVLSLGIGTPTLVGEYIPPEKDTVLFTANGLIGVGPFPTQEEVDPDVVNASKQTVTADYAGGACFADMSTCMDLVRGGHVDMALLGTMEVAENGDLANWMVPGKRISGMGGGMELVQSGCRVVILTNHVNKDGSPKILARCRAPLTACGVVDMIITELCVFVVVKERRRLVLTELADGVTLDDVRQKTEASFVVADDLKPMQQAPILSP